MLRTAQHMPAESTLAQARFSAMGSDVQIVAADASADMLATASEAVRDLERRWSRFRPDSEVSRLNAAQGLRITTTDARSPGTLRLSGQSRFTTQRQAE